jgi:hypothetical protein
LREILIGHLTPLIKDLNHKPYSAQKIVILVIIFAAILGLYHSEVCNDQAAPGFFVLFALFVSYGEKTSSKSQKVDLP